MKINNSCNEYDGIYDLYPFFYNDWRNEQGHDIVPKINSEEFLNWAEKQKF